MRFDRISAVILFFTGLVVQSASAQDYPARRITFVVGYTAGGSTDIAARLVGEKLGTRLGAPVVIENRDGASGTIGAQAVVRAPKDGYTMLFASSNEVSILPAIKKQMPYDVRNDLAPVGLVAMVPLVFAVHPTIPTGSVKELIALATKQPGKMTYASFGIGTSTHLAAELFKKVTRTDIFHVPYKGGGAAMPDLLSGRVDMAFHSVPVALPYIRNGKLRALGYTGDKRSPLMPEVPTMEEAGVPGFVVGSWVGLLAPVGTPDNIVNRVSREVKTIVDSSEVQQAFIAQGLVPAYKGPGDFSQFMESEIKLWMGLVRDTGISVE